MLATVECPNDKRSAAPPLDPLHLDLVRKLIAERYGFWVNDAWSGQVAARLAARAAATGRAGIGDYLCRLQAPDRDDAELVALVESLLNGETHFLRTEPHFDALIETVLTAWRSEYVPGRRLRIASLGCSTGEEPYSIALVLHERLSSEELADVEISAVDVNSRALAAARAGCYDAFHLRDLNPARRARWFQRVNDRWLIHPGLRASVRFLQHNLLEPLPFVALDVIFCRNVLIYFQAPVVARCLREFHAALRPGGFLFLGHAESALGYPEFFEPVPIRDGVIYQNKPRTLFVP